MDQDQDQDLIDCLIAYWLGELPAGDGTFSTCRDLTNKLARSLPASLFEVLQTEPVRHRDAIEEMLRPYLPSKGALSRDFGSRPPLTLSPSTRPNSGYPAPVVSPSTYGYPRPRTYDSPPPQESQGGRGVTISGNGNTGFTTGNVGGPFNVGSSLKPTKGNESHSPSSPKSRRPASPIRILFLGANPVDSMRLRLDEEVREIERSLSSATLGNHFDLQQRWAVRASEIQSHLLRVRPQILHFSGHGSSQSAILLQGDDGNSRPVAGHILARVLEQFKHHLQCVVLNACYSEEQAYAISQHIDCVVGMATGVADRAAIRFSAVFYEALASGRNVQEAFNMGCADIDVIEMGQTLVPQLVTGRKPPGSMVFVES